MQGPEGAGGDLSRSQGRGGADPKGAVWWRKHSLHHLPAASDGPTDQWCCHVLKEADKTATHYLCLLRHCAGPFLARLLHEERALE